MGEGAPHLPTSQGGELTPWSDDDRMILRLERRLAEAGTRDDAINLLQGDPEVCEYISRKLNVVYGAFGVVDQESKSFVLLQGSQQLAFSILPRVQKRTAPARQRLYGAPLPGTEHMPRIAVPLIQADGEASSRDNGPGAEGVDARDVIDLMFLGLRRTQILDTNPPEFFRWTRSKEAQGPFEARLKEQLPFGILHCAAGEVAFYLCAWRWLMRHCQLRGGAADVDRDDVLLWSNRAKEALFPFLWSANVWEGGHTIEGNWQELMDNLSPHRRPGFGEHEDEAVIGRLKENWLRLVNRFDLLPNLSEPTSLLLLDWVRLGLIHPTTGRGTRCLRETLLFAREIAGEREREELDDWLVGRLDSGTSLQGFDTLEGLLRRVFFNHLLDHKPEAETPTLPPRTGFEFLGRLHAVCRFPVLPFFYLSALAGGPREHLVISVWESPSYPATIKDQRTVNDAVFALLLLRPYWEAECWEPAGDKARSGIRMHDQGGCFVWQMFRLQQFFRRVSFPIIERGFYGGLVRCAIFQEGQHKQLWTFAHRTLSIIESINCQLRDQCLFEQMDSATHATLMLLQATIERYRRTQHTASTPFSGAEEDPMALYLFVAASMALERAKGRTETDAAIHCRLKVEEWQAGPFEDDYRGAVRFFLQQSNLGRIEEPAGIDFTIHTESFGVLFVHTLHQALYHSVKYKLSIIDPASYVPPRVTLEVKDARARGRFLHVTIDNPGEPPTEPSKDVGEFAQLAKYFLIQDMAGPDYDRRRCRWVTRFSMRVLR